MRLKLRLGIVVTFDESTTADARGLKPRDERKKLIEVMARMKISSSASLMTHMTEHVNLWACSLRQEGQQQHHQHRRNGTHAFEGEFIDATQGKLKLRRDHFASVLSNTNLEVRPVTSGSCMFSPFARALTNFEAHIIDRSRRFSPTLTIILFLAARKTRTGSKKGVW